MATSRVLGLVTVAIATGAVAAGAQEVSASKNRDRRVITTEEIESAQVNTAYQVVERLRPEFLRRMSRQQTLGGGAPPRGTASRGTSPGAGNTGGNSGGNTGGNSGGNTGGNAGGAGQADPTPDAGFGQSDAPTTAAVLVDGIQIGTVDELQRLQSNLVEEIRYLSGPDAQIKYGPRFPAGVIEVKLKH